MSKNHIIYNPRINTNEDQSQIVEILAEPGQVIKVGDHLATAESTKAAHEIFSDVDGELISVICAIQEMADVGAPLFEIQLSGNQTSIETIESEKSQTEEIKISAKAKKLAIELGVNLYDVSPRSGKIQQSDVEKFFAAQNKMPERKAYRGVPAVVVGGGGHASFVIDCLRGAPINVIGCTDNPKTVGQKLVTGHSILGDDDILPKLLSDGVKTAFVGVGGATENIKRKTIFAKLVDLGFFLPPIVHPSAIIGSGTTIGYGTLIGPGATIGPGCQIGDNVIINQGAIVSHDCIINDHVHLTPGATVAGSVKIGEATTIGMCAAILFGKKIGTNCLVHNGAAVNNDLADYTEYLMDGGRRSLT